MYCFGDDLFQLCASKPLIQITGMMIVWLALVGMTILAATVRRS